MQKTEDSQSSQLKNMGHKLMLSIKMKKKKTLLCNISDVLAIGQSQDMPQVT